MFAQKRSITFTTRKIIWHIFVQETKQIVSALDKNGDGFISYTEFRYLMGGC